MLTHCPQCDYSLDGLPYIHTCPECGLAYEKSTRVYAEHRMSIRWFAGLSAITLFLLYMTATSPIARSFSPFVVFSFVMMAREAARYRGGHNRIVITTRALLIMARGKPLRTIPWHKISGFTFSLLTFGMLIRGQDGRTLARIGPTFLGADYATRKWHEVADQQRLLALKALSEPETDPDPDTLGSL